MVNTIESKIDGFNTVVEKIIEDIKILVTEGLTV